jgi:type I restriction enzyme M protein
VVELGNKTYFDIESGGTPSTTNQKFWNGDINWVTLVDLPQENFITQIQETERKITDDGLKGSSAKLLPENTVLVSSRATIGRIGIAKNKLATNQGFKNIIIKDENKISSLYLAIVMTTKKEEMELMASGGTFKEISKTSFEKIIVPIPDISTQQKIISDYHQEQGIIESNKKLIEIMEKKIEEVLSEI